jgi:Rrf2 family cysteine metabolism transcriptional repressor
MHISTRGRYGLRAMFELARGFGQTPVLMSTVAERQALSRKYLHALLTSLRTAGLVRSVRGAGGGFVLTRPPAEIRLSEVLHALEGPLSLVGCVADPRACDRASRCPARRVWKQVADAVENVLDNVTLEDLLAPASGRCAPGTTRKARRSLRTNGRGSRPSRTISSHHRRNTDKR